MMVNDACIVQRLITTSAHQKGARGSSGQLAVMMWSELWSAFDDDDEGDGDDDDNGDDADGDVEGELMMLIARIKPEKGMLVMITPQGATLRVSTWAETRTWTEGTRWVGIWRKWKWIVGCTFDKSESGHE